MLKRLRSFALAVAMLLPFAAQAQSPWTVADGTTTHAQVPLDFYNCDGSGVRNAQMLYPASLLTDMVGSTLASITFYHQNSASKTVTASPWLIKIGETTETDLSAGFSTATLTTVYSGNLVVVDGVFTFEFTTPYTYNGGNLVVEIYTTGALGNWFGSQNQGCFGVDGIGSTYSSMSNPNYTEFLPKTTFTEQPSCFKVTNLTASNVTTSSVDLAWDDAINTGATYTIYDMADTSVIATNISTTSYTVTGLEGNTAYTLGVVANCSATDASELVSVSLRTACVTIASLPYTMGFEAEDLPGTVSAQAFPFCWTRINTLASGTYTYYPYSYTGGSPRTGSRHLYFYASTYGTYADTTGFVMPELDVATYPMDANRVVFYAKGNATTPYTVLVGTMSDPSDRGTFTLAESLTVNSAAYEKYIVVLSGVPATDPYVAFLVPKATTGMYIDDVTLEIAPSCLDLVSFDVAGITNNSITLSWYDPSNTGATYTIMNGTTEVATGIADTFYTVTGLDANTDYTFTLVANCSATDASVPISVTGHTLCDAIATLPYVENFDGYSNNSPVECWTHLTPMDGNSNYFAATTSATNNSSSGALRFNYSVATANVAALPEFTAPTNTLRMKFWHRAESATNTSCGILEVGYLTDIADTATFVVLDTMIQSSAYAEVIVSYSAAPATAVMAFRHRANGTNWYWNIDDVTVEEIPNCPEPTALALVDMSATSATFNWRGSASGYTATLYDSENTVVGTPQTITDTVCTFNGLTIGQTYTVKVVSNCGSDVSPEVSTSVTIDYCVPNPTSRDNSGITGVAFGGMTNTETRPSSAPFYSDYTAMAGSVPAGTMATVDITYATGYTYGTLIWVDWNSNLTFDADEVVYAGQSTNSNPTTLTATFTVPATQALGNYRMRIAGADSYFDSYVNSGSGTPNPCFTSSYAVVEDYTLTVTEAPSCMPVSDLTISEATDSSITLTWSDDINTGVTYTVLNGTTVLSSEVSALTYTATGLEANTEYTFSVVVNCTGEVSDTISVTGSTTCSAKAIPYTYDFEDVSEFGCWSVENTNASTGIMSSNGYSGAGFTFVYNTNPPQYLISPELSGTENGLVTTFKYKNFSSSWPETFSVGYSTTTSNVNSFTWGEVITATSSQWEDYAELMPAGVKYVAIKLLSNDKYYLYIDDIAFQAPATVTVATADATMGTVEPNGDSIVASGTEFTVTATPVENYHFVAWMNGTDTVSTVNPFTFTVTGDTSLTALFAIDQYTITLAAADAAVGTVEPAGDSTVNHGTSFTATAIANEGYSFVAWLAGTDTVSVENPFTFTVVSDSTLTAVYSINQYTVAATAMPAEAGTVNGVPAEAVDYGTEVTLTAVPEAGYHFLAWLAGTDTVSMENPFTFTAISDTTLTAVFEANIAGTFTVSVDFDATMGTVEGIPTDAVDSASVVTLTAVAAEHYHFVEWSTGDTTATINVTVVSDTTLTALFAIDQHTVSAIAAPAEAGSVEGVPTEAVDYGSIVTLTAVAAEGYHFVEWSTGETTETIEVTVEGDTTLTATFAINQYIVAAVVTPDASGSVSGVPAEAVDHGTELSLTAVPATGYHFVSWSNGATEPTIVITVVSDTTLTATFEANAAGTYTVSVIYDASMGTVAGVPTEPVVADSVITLVATPAEGYVFTGWSNGTTSDTLVITVTEDIVLTANFELFVPNQFVVSVSTRSTIMGTVDPMGIHNVMEADEFTVTATANEGYEFVAWMVGNDTVSTEATYTFTVTASISLVAVFAETTVEEELFLVTGLANDDAMGYVLGGGYYAAGATATLTAQANQGYRFVRWEDNNSTTPYREITVTADVTVTAIFEAVPVGIEDAEQAEVEVIAVDNRIVVRGAESDIYLYDVNGRVLARQAAAATVEFTVNTAGVYLVKVGNAAAKRVAVVR